MERQYAVPSKQTIDLLIELENEGRLHLTRQNSLALSPTSVRNYIFSKHTAWYWLTIVLAAATSIAVFTIPEGNVTLFYLRSLLGSILVLFLPGFALIKALFQVKIPIKNYSENISQIELVALSFGMSLLFVPIIGLILNFTPWGIRLMPITLSLLALTAILATAAVIREFQIKRNLTEARHMENNRISNERK